MTTLTIRHLLDSFIYFKVFPDWEANPEPFLFVTPGNTKGGKYQCTIDLLIDWFGLVCYANKKLSVVIQLILIPNQSNRRSTVQ
jgi:hypothetical protein